MKALPKIFVSLLVLFALLFVAIFVASSMINEDQLKARIQAIVSEKLNAKVDFKSAKFTLFGGPGLELRQVVFENSVPQFATTPLISVDSALLKLQWREVFDRKLAFGLELRKPDVVFLSAEEGNNVTTLFKEKVEVVPTPDQGGAQPSIAETSPPTSPPTSPTATARPEKILGWFDEVTITRADINGGTFSIEKRVIESKRRPVGTFDAKITDIGLGKTIAYAIKANLSYTDEVVILSGPLTLSGSLKYQDGALSPANLRADLTGVVFKGKSYEKNSDVPASVDVTFSYVAKSLKVESLVADLPSIKFEGKAEITDFEHLAATAQGRLDVSDLRVLERFYVEKRAIPEGGQLLVDFNASGRFKKLEDARAEVTINQKYPDADVSVLARFHDLRLPRADFTVTSKRFDGSKQVLPFIDQKFVANPLVRIKGEDLNLRATREGHTTKLDEISLGFFRGKLQGHGQRDELGGKELKLNLSVTRAQVDSFAEFLAPTLQQQVFGQVDFQLALSAETISADAFKRSVSSAGNFQVFNASFDASPLRASLDRELDKAVKGLSSEVVSPQALSKAEKLLADPAVRDLAAKNNIDLEKFKKRFETLQSLRFDLGGASGSRELRPIQGNFRVANGKVNFHTIRVSQDGTLKLDGTAGFTLELAGNGVFSASQKLKDSLVSQSKYASLLFDDNKNFDVYFKLGGSVDKPVLDIDVERLKSTFRKNATAMSEEELNRETQKLVDSLAQRLKSSKLGQEIEKSLQGTPGPNGEKPNAEDAIKRAIDKNREKLKKYLKK